ncbi:MAG: hypothetical protein J1F39_07330 [Clostridiales bacterium]|nr:hypothetical protein [Clostridiales bacterium]
MKFNDYFNRHKMSDESKSVLSSKMKQRARQLRSEAKTRPLTAKTESAPKKKNTFKLHPIRWIAIFMSILIVAVTTPIVYFFGIAPNLNVVPSVKLEFMKNLMVDIDGVTAYSIRTDKNGDYLDVKPLGSDGFSHDGEPDGAAISLLSASIVADEAPVRTAKAASPRSFLYSTKDSYDAGNVEYDNTEKVTFMKNDSVTGDVYDNNGKLIDSTRKVTQYELDSQINRLYTTGRFTYVQFIPIVRVSGEYKYKTPDGETGSDLVLVRYDDPKEYDEYGVSAFDKRDYYSNHLTSSFVIDNETGYFYKIENIRIMGFIGELITDDHGYFYTVSTDANRNLVFTDVCPNKDIQVSGVMLDNHDWIYVLNNNNINVVDREKKTVYYTDKTRYYLDSDGTVYLEENGYLTHKMVDGESIELDEADRRYSVGLVKTGDEYDIYEGSALYDKNLAVKYRLTGGELYVNGNWRWLNDSYDTIIGYGNDGTLYYKTIDLEDYRNQSVTLSMESDFTPFPYDGLTEVTNYYLQVGDDSYKVNNVWRRISISETVYYRLAKTETGVELIELSSKQYEGNVFIFQPINK